MENLHKAIASIRQLLAESREWARPQQVAAFAAIKVMLRELEEYLEEEQPPGWGYVGEKLASLTFHTDALFGMNEDNGHDTQSHHVWALGDLDTMERNIPARS